MRTGAQNNSDAEKDEKENAPEESSVPGFGTTPSPSVVVQPPLDEVDGDVVPVGDEVLPDVAEAALTTPKTRVTSWLDAPMEEANGEEEAAAAAAGGADVSSASSSATAPSGDGEGEGSPPDFSQNPDMMADYQADSAEFYLPVSQAVRRECV